MPEDADGYLEEEFEEEIKPLTFDEMVSFTMFTEVFLVAASVVIFFLYVYLTL